MPGPDLLPGAPQPLIWVLGIVFIGFAITLVALVVVMACNIHHEARSCGAPAWLWLLATLLGGWVTMVIWQIVRPRYELREAAAAVDRLAKSPD
jgi:hypothetical protein